MMGRRDAPSRVFVHDAVNALSCMRMALVATTNAELYGLGKRKAAAVHWHTPSYGSMLALMLAVHTYLYILQTS